MRFYLQTFLAITSGMLLLSGCSKQPEAAPQVVLDQTLPTPLLNGHISDMNAIAFEWKSIDDTRVQGYYVYRSDPKSNDEKLHRHATIQGRYVTHFVDTDLQPNQSFAYRFSSYSESGAESQASKTYRASTSKRMPSVSFFTTIGNMPRSAKLIWRPHTDSRVKGYRIERKLRDDEAWQEIAMLKGRLHAEYIDTDLKDEQVYKYRLFAQTFDGMESSPSDTITVVTKPLPEPISNISVSQNLPRKIRIAWDASSRENLDHYNIYRSTSANGRFDYHVKLHETVFSDPIERDGAIYYYKITAVDTDGLESLKGSTAHMGMTLNKPATPQQVKASLQDHTLRLSWDRGSEDTVSYVIIKTRKEGWFDKSVQEFKEILTTRFADTELVDNATYGYQVLAVNQYGIRSEPSELIEITVEAR